MVFVKTTQPMPCTRHTWFILIVPVHPQPAHPICQCLTKTYPSASVLRLEFYLSCLCHCIWLNWSNWCSPLSKKVNAQELTLQHLKTREGFLFIFYTYIFFNEDLPSCFRHQCPLFRCCSTCCKVWTQRSLLAEARQLSGNLSSVSQTSVRTVNRHIFSNISIWNMLVSGCCRPMQVLGLWPSLCKSILRYLPNSSILKLYATVCINMRCTRLLPSLEWSPGNQQFHEMQHHGPSVSCYVACHSFMGSKRPSKIVNFIWVLPCFALVSYDLWLSLIPFAQLRCPVCPAPPRFS